MHIRSPTTTTMTPATPMMSTSGVSRWFFQQAVSCLLLILSILSLVESKDMSLAQTPPLGWRSWNLFGPHVDQTLLQSIMEGMVSVRRPDHENNMVSLCDIGYCDVGLDDNWQDCESPLAASGMHYHAANGQPLINTTRFPSMANMTAYGHARGLTVGWYHNNCICRDHCNTTSGECEAQIQGDVQALLDYQFDAVKLDGCGGQRDLGVWDFYFGEASIVVENCHWGVDTPPSQEECPYHFYRTTGDIRPNYGSVMHNLHTVENHRAQNVSFPGCWAYPDMLQVGVERDYDGNDGLTSTETRSHFGAWAIISSPLILSHDVNNETLTDTIWDIIANREVIAVNQAYAGDSGGVFVASNTTVQLNDIHGWQMYPGMDNPPEKAQVWVPSYQYLAKPLGSGKVAVLLMNCANETVDLVLRFDTVPGDPCGGGGCQIRDIWNHEALGVFTGDDWTATGVSAHDAVFIILQAATTTQDKPETNDEPTAEVEEEGTPAHSAQSTTFIAIPLVTASLLLYFARKWRRNQQERDHDFDPIVSNNNDPCEDPVVLKGKLT